jgi:hypothetical protein
MLKEAVFMIYKDANGIELKDGDYVLTTGDGIAAFAKPQWRAEVFRIHNHDGESGFCCDPIYPPHDGSQRASFPAREGNGQFISTYRIDRESAIAFASRERDAQNAYEEALAAYRQTKVAQRVRQS